MTKGAVGIPDRENKLNPERELSVSLLHSFQHYLSAYVLMPANKHSTFLV